jgi:hypothetical protein
MGFPFRQSIRKLSEVRLENLSIKTHPSFELTFNIIDYASDQLSLSPKCKLSPLITISMINVNQNQIVE